MQTGTLTVSVTVTTRGGQLAQLAGVCVGAGAGVTEELSVAMGTTDSEVRVSQGVLLGEGDEAGAEGTTAGVVEGEGAMVGATSGVSLLVAMGTTDSEVRVSQGVLLGAGLEGCEGIGEGFTTGCEEGVCTGATVGWLSELVAMGTTLSEVIVSQGVDDGLDEGATLEGAGAGITAGLEGRGAGLDEDCTTGTEEVC